MSLVRADGTADGIKEQGAHSGVILSTPIPEVIKLFSSPRRPGDGRLRHAMPRMMSDRAETKV